MGFVRKNVFTVLWKCVFSDLPVLDVPSPSAHDHYRWSLFNTGAAQAMQELPFMLYYPWILSSFLKSKKKKSYARSSAHYSLNNQQCNNIFFKKIYIFCSEIKKLQAFQSQELLGCGMPRGL